MRFLRKVPYFVFAFWRIVLPLYLWQAPFLVTVGAVLLDIDWQLFVLGFTGEKEELYQKIDKALDFYWYSVAFVFASLTPYWPLFTALFAIRLTGEILFYLKGNREIFLYFPNIFENFFIFYISALKFPGLQVWLEGTRLWLVIFVLAVLKLVQEYLVHVNLFDVPSWIRSVFNVGADLRVHSKSGQSLDD